MVEAFKKLVQDKGYEIEGARGEFLTSMSFLTVRNGDFEEGAALDLNKEYDKIYHFKKCLKREDVTVEKFERDYLSRCG